MSPADDGIYLTNSEAHQVWRVGRLENVDKPEENLHIIAGTGEKCTPGDREKCGDGGPARQAKLTFPKGIAVSLDKTIYITDGKQLRRIDQTGIITTLIGNQAGNGVRPMGCELSYPTNEIELHWPNKLAVSPVDGSLHIVDENQETTCCNEFYYGFMVVSHSPP